VNLDGKTILITDGTGSFGKALIARILDEHEPSRCMRAGEGCCEDARVEESGPAPRMTRTGRAGVLCYGAGNVGDRGGGAHDRGALAIQEQPNDAEEIAKARLGESGVVVGVPAVRNCFSDTPRHPARHETESRRDNILSNLQLAPLGRCPLGRDVLTDALAGWMRSTHGSGSAGH